jgi:hypothetical protein
VMWTVDGCRRPPPRTSSPTNIPRPSKQGDDIEIEASAKGVEINHFAHVATAGVDASNQQQQPTACSLCRLSPPPLPLLAVACCSGLFFFAASPVEPPVTPAIGSGARVRG